MKSLVIPFLFLAAVVQAGVVHAELRCAELTLKNGQVLRDAVIKSYNDVNGNVTILVGKNMQAVPIAMLPPEAAAKLRALAPEKSPEEKAAAQKDEKAKLAKAEKAQAEREKRALKKLEKDEDARRRVYEKQAEMEMERERDVPALVLNAAQVRANNYFKSDRIEFDDPEQVPGWSGRWRVKGRAYGGTILGKSDGKSGRGYRDFEMIVEDKGKGSPKVIEVVD